MDKAKKRLCVGLLAHVDAGKTTLSEAMLFLSGRIKKLGRVDHRDSYLDTHTLERERGITIFSKQALLRYADCELTLLDTPGHVDFAAEAERSLQALDCAVLVISGTDGVQAHTETLWRLLRRTRIPCFLFVTKMDLPGCDEAALMHQLQAQLSDACVDFSAPEEQWMERAALCDEAAMEQMLASGSLPDETLRALIARRALFPCLFGSGLKTDGVEALLLALDRFAPEAPRKEDFAARVYKITRDAQGKRLSWLKLTGGSLKVRAPLVYRDERGETREEKVTQLRLYSGLKFDAPEEVFAGQCCAVTGLSATWPGLGLGAESDAVSPVLEPVLSYRVLLPQGADAALLLPKFLLLQEEDPQLHVLWNERSREIHVQLMGKVQTEILKSLVKERFDLDIALDTGRVLYRETISDKVEGVGHFEPLRHYAEVHLLLEPLPRGSGIVLDTVCSEDTLDRNWQRLILTHLGEKQHLGVLTGSPLTDVKITLAAGRAHEKHTEGGDFRQATYRALRQGLMRAQSVLLEPYYAYTIEVAPDQIGRVISDVRTMGGSFGSPEDTGQFTRLEGRAPVAAMNGYPAELVSFTRGKGRISLRPDGYMPCRDAPSVIARIGYEPERDLDNPADSVFCAHGAGFNVNWKQVPEYMHLPSCLRPRPEPSAPRYQSYNIDERELEAIMTREFGPARHELYRAPQRIEPSAPEQSQVARQQTLIVDGYNLIYAMDELKALAADELDLARGRLMDMLCSYSAFTRIETVLVFDAYRRPSNPGTRTDYHNIHVAFTAEGETADMYIEALVREIGKNYAVRVVTGDSLIRLSALRAGVLRVGSKEFEAELRDTLSQIEELLRRSNQGAHTTRLKDGTT